MKHVFYLLFLLLNSPLLVEAQASNYMATDPNTDSPNLGFNTSVGSYAGNKTMTGIYNSFIGSIAGTSNSTGSNNAFLGLATGYSNSTGSNNVLLGYQAGYFNTTGSSNLFVGTNAGYSNTAGLNSFLGSEAGYANTTGTNNAFLGYRTGYANTTGSSNTFLGWRSGRVNTTGGSNTFVGSEAGVSSTTGTGNTFVGQQAGNNVTTGSHNIIIGSQSGTAITTSDDNVLIGYNSQADDGLQNATAIGANTRVVISNALVLGNGVNVGIGTSAPTRKLELVADGSDESGLRLTRLTSQSKIDQVTDQFLTVNELGDVVKARYQLRVNTTREWSDKVFAPTYQLRPLASVASYIGQHGHLPGIPSADQVVQDGIDLVKLNATLLEKIEELTLYSIQLEKADQAKQQTLQHQQAQIDELKQLVRQLLDKK